MNTELDKSSNGEVTGKDVFSSFEIDAIGEILNISMGSAATAVSTLLDKKVLITTPTVEVSKVEDLEYSSLEPAMCVEITYITGISGSNIMILRQSDIKLILDQLMGLEPTPDENYVFDEISISAACEVMNQMMGSSATALSNFLGRAINISTPVAYLLDSVDLKQNLSVKTNQYVVVVNFDLIIEGIMQSKFMSIMQMDLAKDIVAQSRQFNTPEKEESTTVAAADLPELSQPAEALLQKVYQEPQFDEPIVPAQPDMGGRMSQNTAAPPMADYRQPYPQQPMQQPTQQPMQQYPPQYYQQPQYNYEQSNVVKQPVDIHNVNFQNFPNIGQPSADGQHTNLDLILQVPLQVTVEIGKTKKKIKDILEFSQGMVIELEKQAGAPVDVIVNGQLVARGDVVVVEDNFGVRITEILKNTDFINGIS